MLVKCIKDVVMNTGEVAFINGRIYGAYENKKGELQATNEQNEFPHIIRTTQEWFDEYFIEITGNMITITEEEYQSLLSDVNYYREQYLKAWEINSIYEDYIELLKQNK